MTERVVDVAGEPTAESELLELLAPLFARPAWQADAACREHPEVNFFPTTDADPRPALAICSTCAVRDECAAFARSFEAEVGVWGGTLAGRAAPVHHRTVKPRRRAGPSSIERIARAHQVALAKRQAAAG
jgi:hypothetical protein